MNYTLYILYSPSHDQIYIGYTSHLLQRFKSHQQLGKDWTARFRPWTLIYCEYFTEKTEAIKREKQIKQYRNRLRIRSQIKKQFQALGYIEINVDAG